MLINFHGLVKTGMSDFVKIHPFEPHLMREPIFKI